MRLRCSSVLPIPAGGLADELARTAVFLHVTAPLLVFTPVDPPVLPTTWAPGVYLFELRIDGRLLIGEHTIVARVVEPAAEDRGGEQLVWHDAGHSGAIRSWDHKILIEPLGADARYIDVVDIHAGPLTVPAWLFAHVFYRHRQRRLRRLVASRFAGG